MQSARSDHPISPDAAPLAAPGLLRRLGTIVYDALLLLAVLFFATAILLPFNAGEAFSSKHVFYPAYLIIVSFLFYAWFWIHGGQTLGMRAWKIKLHSADGRPMNWRRAAMRFAVAGLSWACLGLGFVWCLFDPQRRCWHDAASNTRLVIDQR